MKQQWILVAATIFSSPLLAQTASPDSIGIKALEEVVVTANKFPQKQLSTGKVLTVIDRETLAKNSGRNLTQVLNEQAGLQINGAENAPGTNQTVYLRGAAAANTLILVDGMPVTDGSGITIQADLNHYAIDQVERVEILKGPQSTLYGSDAVAGVINIITRKSQSDKPLGFNGELAGGSYGTAQGKAGLSGKSGLFNYSAQYSRFRTDGFSAAYDPTGKNNFDRDGYRQDLYSASLGFSPSKAWTLRGSWQYSNYKADIDDDALADDRNNTIHYQQQLAALQSVNRFSKGALTVNLNYTNIRRRYDDKINSPVGNNDYDPYEGDYKGRSLFAETFLSLELQQHLQLLTGIDYRKNSADIRTTYGALGKDSLESSMMSAYASLSLKELKGFGGDLGGRLTQHKDFGEAFTYSFSPYYLLLKNLKIYGTIGTAFRAPSVYHLASEYGNRQLDPERSFQYEAGMQWYNRNKQLMLRATYFNRRIKDVIIFQNLFDPPYGKYVNADKQADNGVELEWIYKPGSKWQFNLNYTYLDGAITTKESGKDSSYFNLYRRPKHNINAGAGWQATSRLFVRASLHWVDKREDLYFNPTTYAVEPKSLASYYTLNAFAQYRINAHLEAYLDLANLTNQQYFDLYGYNNRRFNLMTGIKLRW